MRARVGVAAAGGDAARPPVPHPELRPYAWSRCPEIYTRGGDQGRTSLGDGTRVAKHAGRVAAYGTVDEANAAIGLARLHTTGDADAMLARIQNDLFDLGADLCRPGDDSDEPRRCGYATPRSSAWSARSTRMNAELRPLNSFVLPGGTPGSRLSASRPHRDPPQPSGWSASSPRAKPVNPAAIRYFNRLSDHLFVLSRWLNDKGAADVLWVPGANR